MEKLKRVDQPTTRITDDVQRFDEREQGFKRAARGDFGSFTTKESARLMKYPVQAAEAQMLIHLSRFPVQTAEALKTMYGTDVGEGGIASSKAPIPEDPAILSRHIKSLGYFLRADVVGICRLPQYAVYSHDKDGNPIELSHKFAIVVAVDQGYETMDASTGYDWISGSQSFRSYSAGIYGLICSDRYFFRPCTI